MRQTIRVGDIVKVVKPSFIQRVGYPISFDMALEHVQTNFESEIKQLLQATGIYESEPIIDGPWTLHTSWPPNGRYEKPYNRICRALAIMYLENEGYGGKERKLYIREEPERLNKEFKVVGKKVVKTGTYYPAWSEQSYEGEWDGGPGGLDNCKTHVLLELCDWSLQSLQFSHNLYENNLWIERCNVEVV